MYMYVNPHTYIPPGYVLYYYSQLLTVASLFLTFNACCSGAGWIRGRGGGVGGGGEEEDGERESLGVSVRDSNRAEFVDHVS
jgi:hypothetical protein